jgi:hypothetical protein
VETLLDPKVSVEYGWIEDEEDSYMKNWSNELIDKLWQEFQDYYLYYILAELYTSRYIVNLMNQPAIRGYIMSVDINQIKNWYYPPF